MPTVASWVSDSIPEPLLFGLADDIKKKLWLGGGPMWEPIAIAIIFGLLFATVLTVGVVPVLYTLFFRLKFKGVEL